MFKVVQLQISPYSAGRAAKRLHEAFLEENIDSAILSLYPDVNDTEKMKHLNMKARIRAWLDTKLQKYLTRNNYKQFGQYSFPFLGNNVSKMDMIKKADIIYLNWIQGGFLNFANIEKLAKLGKPIILFMHDMWYITGGCHHSFSCEKFKTTCNKCQMFPDNNLIDWPLKEFNRKLELYSKYSNLYFVSPSKWLFNSAKQAFLTKDKPVFYIPNVYNEKLFKPFDKSLARYILNIDVNVTVIAFGAVSVGSPYKGWGYLQKALEILREREINRNILILIFGGGYDKLIEDSIPFKTKFMGFLKDEYSLALVYNSSDVFVMPSLADNQPTTVMESMGCGNPVVGFDIGGLPDMIKHKENGYLAKYKDAEDIAIGIKFCLDNNVKGKVLPFFEESNIIRKHIELINSIV